MSKFVLAIDQGTTGSTVSLVDESGQIVSHANTEFEQIYPQPGWVEHDPEAIWSSVKTSLEVCIQKSGIDKKQIVAIGITNQRETVVLWDRSSGTPVHNAIVWQCRRTADICSKLKKKGIESDIKRRSGLVLDPYFSGTKINWMINNVSGLKTRIKNNEIAAGTIDSFLVYKLTSGECHATEVSNASRTMLMNLKTMEWDEKLLSYLKVPESILPEIVSSSGTIGVTQGLDFLPDNIPISGIAGDQQAALFGQTAFKPGDSKVTFGTGSFLLMNTGSQPIKSKSGLLTTVGWQLDGQKPVYALEGGAFICGAAVQWLRDELKFFESSKDIEKLAKTVDSSEGVELIPAFVGLGAPYWDPNVRAALFGMTRGSSKAHIARATLEAMALQNVDILNAMKKDLGKSIKGVRVDGGAAANNLLMQIQADYLGSKIQRPKMIETTVAGAAYLAGLGVGLWKSLDEIKSVWSLDSEFAPQIKSGERTKRLSRWHTGVKSARYYSKQLG